MSAARARQLHIVRDSPPLDELLAALDRWRDATRDSRADEELAAYLEIGDEELTSDSWLTVAQVQRLARILAGDARTACPGEGGPW